VFNPQSKPIFACNQTVHKGCYINCDDIILALKLPKKLTDWK